MPRPKICRRIRFQPDATYFKPAGVRKCELEEILISFEEMESIRLIDFEEMEQSKAAQKMKVSQPTLSRMLKSGRKKLASAIVNGKAIKITGGNYKFS